jgi:uncharacterized membrane protein
MCSCLAFLCTFLMHTLTYPKLILTALIAALLTATLFAYPMLPDTVVVHFDGMGYPDGWQEKSSFVMFLWLMVLFAVGIFLPLLRLIGSPLVNARYAEWDALTPRTQEAVLMVQHHALLWLSCIIVSILAEAHGLLLVANVQDVPYCSPFWGVALVGIMLVKIGIWLILLVVRQKRVLVDAYISE